MTIKTFIIKLLLQLYPKAWRAEYGSELADILTARPLDVRVIADVMSNALWQQVRAVDTTTELGLAAMLVIGVGIVWNIAAAPPSSHALVGLLEETSKTLPTVVVAPLMSELYVLFLVLSGCSIHLRGGKLSESGVAAMKISFIAGIPVMLIGILMLLGVLGVAVVGPSESPSHMAGHGLFFTYYNPHHHVLNPWAVLFAPLSRIPESWIWGLVGGQVGRTILRWRRPQIDRSPC